MGLLADWPFETQEAERAGLAFALQKPVELDELLHHIAACLTPPWSLGHQQQAQILTRYLLALSSGDWATVRALCVPDVRYSSRSWSVLMPERAIQGIEAYLAAVQAARRRLPGFQMTRMRIFQQPTGPVARYVASWQGPGSERHRIAGSVTCRFRGDRIAHISVALNMRLLHRLLEPDQDDTGP